MPGEGGGVDLAWRIGVAAVTAVLTLPAVGLFAFAVAFSGNRSTLMAVPRAACAVLAVCGAYRVWWRSRNGGFRVEETFSLGWVVASTLSCGLAGCLLSGQAPIAVGVACGFVGGLAASLVWSRRGTAPRSGGGLPRPATLLWGIVLLLLTLAGVAKAILTMLGHP